MRICFLCFYQADVPAGAGCTCSGQPSPMVEIPELFKIIGHANAERKKGTMIDEVRVGALTKSLRILQGLEESETVKDS